MPGVTAAYSGTFDPGDFRPHRHHRACCGHVRALDRRGGPESVEESALFHRRARGPESKRQWRRRGCIIVSVKPFDGLIVDFARENNVSVLVRGVRTVTDVDYEKQMGHHES